MNSKDPFNLDLNQIDSAKMLDRLLGFMSSYIGNKTTVDTAPLKEAVEVYYKIARDEQGIKQAFRHSSFPVWNSSLINNSDTD
jgi:hypothetical protein